MTKLQTVGEEDKFNKKLFIFQRANIKKEKKKFYVTGDIRDKKFDNDNVVLTITNSDGKGDVDVDCSIEKKVKKEKVKDKEKKKKKRKK